MTKRGNLMSRLLMLAFFFAIFGTVQAQDSSQEASTVIFTEARPDAPDLAQRGPYTVGVRTLALIDEGQVDLSRAMQDADAVYDRLLETEIWYPAIIPEGEQELTEYVDSNIVEGFTFLSRALRDAEPDLSDGPYPLIIMSHGLGGSRLQMTHLGDHLASHGFVVAAIDHADGPVGLGSVQTGTFYRPVDIAFVLDTLAEAGIDDLAFADGLVDADNTGLIGYSYGGYGALIASGAGITETITSVSLIAPGGKAAIHQAGSVERDERIKAVFTFAPFGMDLRALGLNTSYWDADGLAGIDIPLFIMVGDADDVAFYETGSLPIFDAATNTDRYLLTVLGARHNVAPNPSPPTDDLGQFFRHGEPVWDSFRLNNIGQHFTTAFMGLYLQDADYAGYLDLIEVAAEGSVSQDTQWTGFPERTALGLEFRFRPAGS